MDRPKAADQVVGRYREFELLEELGSGSFARVYKVRAPGHRRPMALKLASDTKLAPDVIKRAIREIAVLRSLTSPHVAHLHGSSVGEDHFYVLMDYLEGQQLDEHHNIDEPMQAAEALKVLLQACIGLAEAHAQGVVHRDLKPANIWITTDGTVKVLDFGLARAWDVPWAFGTDATTARSIVGTPHYCQPEQLLTDQLTPASDVYSMATVLYELLSGHAVLFPHQRVSEVVEALHDSPLSWLDAHAMREMTPITGYPGCAGLPDALLDLLKRALDKEPSARPQNAGVLASELGTILFDDLGAIEAGSVHVVGEGGTPVHHNLVPGRRTLGSGSAADIQVHGTGIAEVHALIDWSGSPRPIQIRPADGQTLGRNGDTLRRVTTVEVGDVYAVGSVNFVISAP